MGEPTVVFCGNFHDQHIAWSHVTPQYGWRLCEVPSIEDLGKIADKLNVAAVFVQSDPGELAERIEKIRALLPNARVVFCYPHSAPMLADELVCAGAFHSIPRPLNEGDVKRCLGFVWEAWSRSARKEQPRKFLAAASS